MFWSGGAFQSGSKFGSATILRCRVSNIQTVTVLWFYSVFLKVKQVEHGLNNSDLAELTPSSNLRLAKLKGHVH